MSDLAIRVRDLGKRYRINARQKRATRLRDALKEAALSPMQYLLTTIRPPTEEEILWALKDVSFDVKRGEVVGIVGLNGSGKSTLLKILSRITEPTTGYADLYGRVGSLLEVGTGFHPELTGRENVYMNGAMLGMTRLEINRKFDEIVEFADTGRFVDTPVKRYSSGMYVRLAFAVAAHLEPEVLIVDEVLAVGDAAFQKKCLGKMSEVAHEGRTVLFVSHSMGSVNALCERAIWLNRGEVVETGPTQEVTSNYLSYGTDIRGQHVWKDGIATAGDSRVKLTSAKTYHPDSPASSSLDYRRPFYLEMAYRVEEDIASCRAGYVLSTLDGIVVFERFDSDWSRDDDPRKAGEYVSRCEIPGDLLSPGRYFVTIIIETPGEQKWVHLENILSFYIEDTDEHTFQGDSPRRGILRPHLEWETRLTTNHLSKMDSKSPTPSMPVD